RETLLSSPRKRGPIFQRLWLWVPAFAGTTGRWPLTAALFLLAALRHAGAVRVDLVVAPDVLLILPGLGVAVLQRLRAVAAHSFAALREARRRQRRRRKRDGKRGKKRADPHHGRPPLSFLRESPPTRGRVRLDRVNPKAAPSRGRNGPLSPRKTPDIARRSIARAQRRRHAARRARIVAELSCLNLVEPSREACRGNHYEMVMRSA